MTTRCRKLEQKGAKSSQVGRKGGKKGGKWSKMGPRLAKMGPKGDKLGPKKRKKGLKVELRRAMTDHDATNSDKSARPGGMRGAAGTRTRY